MIDILIRPMQSGDLAFVKSTWLRHYKEHSEFGKSVRNSVYFPNHSLIVERILSYKNTLSLIASHQEEPEVIMGFLVCGTQPVLNPVVHYAYVIDKARKLGIGKELVKSAGLDIDHCDYTHRTKFSQVFADKFPNLTFNPYRI